MLSVCPRQSSGVGGAGVSRLPLQAWRRAQQHLGHWRASELHLTHTRRAIHTAHTAADATADGGASPSLDRVTIGDVSVPRLPRTAFSRPDLVPGGFLAHQLQSDSQETLHTLRWMMQKYLLKQDVFLIGPPGPRSRQIAFRFGEVCDREMEYVSISRDTTEADLKQRAEVVRGSLHYIDQPPVRCAIFGRILVIDGLEKAERNVLPTLNNLLENREMALEDGRFLLHHTAYDALLQKGLTTSELTARKLLRCHEDFRVIALGLPVPRYPGYTLDPPLRSRFQSRAVLNLPLVSQIDVFAQKYPNVDRELLVSLLSARETLRIFEAENANTSLGSSSSGGAPTKMPHFSAASMEHLLRVVDLLPSAMQPLHVSAAAWHRAYPFTAMCDTLQSQTVFESLDRFGIHQAKRSPPDAQGRVVVQVEDLANATPNIWVVDDKATIVRDDQDDDADAILLRTPTALTSTPEQTVALIAAQQRIPTAGDLSTAAPVGSKTKYRLPRGQTIEVTLTTTAPDTGRSPVEPPVVHRLRLQGGIASGPASTPAASSTVSDSFIPTAFHRRLLAPLLLDLAAGKDVCLISPKGAGKSSFIRWVATNLLAYRSHQVHVVHMYRDQTSRDLLQRRSTDADGNTVWTTTSIVDAALTGGIAILDGLERVPPATLQVLRRLIEDREVTLFDGTRLVRHDRFLRLLERHTPEELANLRIFPVLPSFRVIALAAPPSAPGSTGASGSSQSNWLIEETLPLFSFHQLGSLDGAARADILARLFPRMPSAEIARVIGLVEALTTGRAAVDAASGPAGSTASASAAQAAPHHAVGSFPFSLRQCIQLLTHHAQYPSDLLDHVRRMLLYEFLPTPQRDLLDAIIDASEFAHEQKPPVPTIQDLLPRIADGRLHIGAISYPISTRASNPALIPRILFYDVHSQLLILQAMLKDWLIDSPDAAATRPFSHRRHLLLIGNQGVGKNKLADRLLELLRLEREYMQLHRDTTVQALTLSPSLVDGRVFYEDSALVRAVKMGRVLVIDEADKAPLEVVAILKGLVQDGEMALSDGRKIVAERPEGAEAADARFITMHPEFRLIVLANRPGFPFLGNDFFRENGDVFSVHSIPNPDPESEVALLRSYGPNVPVAQLELLVGVFNDLRHLCLEGTFSYPYSTRELVAITKQVEKYPGDGLLAALDNVLDFDRFDASAMRNLREVFSRHGLPIGATHGAHNGVAVELADAQPLPQPRLVQTWASDASVTSGASRGGLSANPTAAGKVGRGTRSFSTSGASSSSVLSSTPLTARTWTLHLDGQSRANDSFENRRLTAFTEEKASWKVPLMATVSRPIAMATLSDDSVHILTSKHLMLHSFFPRTTSGGGYHRCISIDLEDFLPMYEIAEESLQMVAMPNQDQVVLFAPMQHLVVIVAFEKPDEESIKNAHGTQPVPKCSVSVLALQPPNTSNVLSATFLEYLSPGFKMPRWHSRASNQSNEVPKPFQMLDSLATFGLLLFLQPTSRFFMVLDLSAETLSTPRASTGLAKGQQVAANLTTAVTKLGALPVGVLSIVDLAPTLSEGATIEKLVALSPTNWIVETSDQRRFMSTGPTGSWRWTAVSATRANGATPLEQDGGFLAHEHGWFYTNDDANVTNITEAIDAPAVLPRRIKPLHGTPMEYLDRVPEVAPFASSLAWADIPSAQAIFIPRNRIPAPSTATSTNATIMNAFARNSSFLAPPSPSSLYRFSAGGDLFNPAVEAAASGASSVYEVPLPSLPAREASVSGEATYHSWLSVLLPHSSQLAMPAYFTYHLPPPGPDATGPYISKVEQPIFSIIDLPTRRVRHVPIRAHPSDATASSSAKMSIDKFRTTSRPRVDPTLAAEEKMVDVQLDAQALEESLGAEVAASLTSSSPSTFLWSRDRVLAVRVLPQTGDLVTLQANGRVRVWEVDPRRLAAAAVDWRRLFGLTSGPVDAPLRLDLPSDRKREAAAPKVGKVDKENKPHVGGNQWKGGTGGADTAGLGGKAGPYRVDSGNDVHQMSPEEKAKVSAEVAAAAKALGAQELAKRLGAIDLAAEDHELYSQYRARVLKQVSQLRLILEQAEARQVEREWLRHQRDGDLDDGKIVDAITGERMVYRRRGVPTAQSGAIQRLPKRLHFVLDVSGSMYRFNGTDQRLERLLEAALLIMESLEGFEQKYTYSIVGHSGDSASVPFVPYGGAPKTRKDRLKVLQRMYAHSQYCSSGDHTLEAVRAGVKDVVAGGESDENLLVVVSDANLRRYGIPPSQLASALVADPRVNAFVVFIASLADEAHRILPQMPPGRAFFCAETAALPQTFRTILTSTDIIAA